jgi:enamine deaminase RidA (YjgF/YER057c/UK114 family)
MRGHRLSSGSKFEEIASYSRAVVLPDQGGDWVLVSGTTGFDFASMTIAPDVEDQTHQTFRNIAQALEKSGSSLSEVVQIRVYLAAAEDFPRVAPIIGQYMHAAMPANTTVVAPLVDARMRIEVEVTARKLPGG